MHDDDIYQPTYVKKSIDTIINNNKNVCGLIK